MSRGLVKQLIAAPSVFIQPAHFHQKDLSTGDERKAEPSGNGAAGDHGAVLVEHGEPVLLSVYAEYTPGRTLVGKSGISSGVLCTEPSERSRKRIDGGL